MRNFLQNPAGLVLLTLFLTVCFLVLPYGSVWGGNVSGKTFSSSKFAPFEITVPEGWKIIDTEDEEPVNKNVYPVAEFKRLKAIDGSKPKGKIQAIKAKSTTEKFANDLKKGLENSGIEITTMDKFTADSKELYQLVGVMRTGTTKAYVRFHVFAGKDLVFQITFTNDADDRDYESELQQLVSSLKWQ